MVDWLVFVLWIILLPLIFLMAGYRWIGVELAVSVVWVAFLASVAVGLWTLSQESDRIAR